MSNMEPNSDPFECPTPSEAAAAFLDAATAGGHSTGNGGIWHPPSLEKLEDQLPLFHLEKMIGRGGMGAVYRAKQKSLDRTVAIKILPPEFSKQSSFAVRFEREAKALAKLNHPNIVQVFDFGLTEGGYYFIVMEFVDGTDFFQVMQKGELDPTTALQGIRQICDAIEYAHEQGFIHRDIKPANIFINKKGVLKVGDFGLAKLTALPDSESVPMPILTQEGAIMGTPDYIAPEQLGGQEVDHRADIYSLGVMFYEMLTGGLPRGNFPPPSKNIELDQRWDQIVLKAMNIEPDRRYSTITEMRTDVEAIRTKPVPEVNEKPPRMHRKKQRLLGWLIAAILLVVAGIFGYPFLMGGGSRLPDTDRQVERLELAPLVPKVEKHSGHSFNCWRGRLVEFRTTETDWSPEEITPIIESYDHVFLYLADLTGADMGGKTSPYLVYEALPSLKLGLHARLNPHGDVHIDKNGFNNQRNMFKNEEFLDAWLIELGLERVVKQMNSKIGYPEFSGEARVRIPRALLWEVQMLSLERLNIQSKRQHSTALLAENKTQAAAIYQIHKEINWFDLAQQGHLVMTSGRLTLRELFSSAVAEMYNSCGGEDFLRRFFLQELPRLPPALTNQQAMDHFYIAASRAANKDLSDLFIRRLRWPVSVDE